MSRRSPWSSPIASSTMVSSGDAVPHGTDGAENRVSAVEQPVVCTANAGRDELRIHRLVVDGRRSGHHARDHAIQVDGQSAREEPLSRREKLVRVATCRIHRLPGTSPYPTHRRPRYL